jgi:uncharacterized protein
MKKQSGVMKSVRKWSRILHRDIGYFFIGATLIYAISGIALNHIGDWNPNYSVETENFTTGADLSKTGNETDEVLKLCDFVDSRDNYKKHYYPDDETIKIFMSGGSSIVVDLKSGQGTSEILEKRILFYEVNLLHYNPSDYWKWYSDVFAVALILFAITSFFMVKGRKGMIGRGGIYTALGIIIPVVLYIIVN